MIVYRSLEEIPKAEPMAIALGNFDGMHPGHKAVIEAAAHMAEEQGLLLGIFTFSNLSRQFLGQKEALPIAGNREKLARMEAMRADRVFLLPFNEALRDMEPEDFVTELLMGRCGLKALSCGFNFRFGKGGRGTPELLREMGEKLGFTVNVEPACTVDGEVVSSSLIRGLIREGKMEEAAHYLGHPYSLAGTVMPGLRKGSDIRYPTANIQPEEGRVFPPNGVYASRVLWKGEWHPAVSNLGERPTVGDGKWRLETHIFGFGQDIYGDPILVELLKMIRPERKFASMEELKEQIRKDCLTAQAYNASI